MRRLSQEEVIERFRKAHGDKYDYSNVNYINKRTKIKIICPFHGSFLQLPEVHYKHGCPKCKKRNSKKETIISEFKEVHGDKYDYSKVNYIDTDTKVEIICPIHGSFFQTPYHHKKGCGCPACSGVKKLTTEAFIQEAKKVHGDRYDYSNVNYINCHTPVEIICPIHGSFFQLPANHLKNGQNCAKCTKPLAAQKARKAWCKKARESFLKAVKEKYGDKYIILEEYENSNSKIKIKCSQCGKEFTRISRNFLDGYECPYCYGGISKAEKELRELLKNEGIEFEAEYKFENLKDKDFLRYDFYIPSKNLLIELNGKQHYFWIKKFHKTYHDFLVQKHHDWIKRKFAREHNFNYLVIPYNEEISNWKIKIL